jgi:PAS domain-containing protein
MPVTPTGDVPVSNAEYGRVIGGEIPLVRFEKRYRAQDSGVVRVRITVSPIRDEQGAVEHLLSVVEDLPGSGDDFSSP